MSDTFITSDEHFGLLTIHAGDLFWRYVQQSRRRGWVWELTKEEAKSLFVQPCYYCGDAPAAVKTIPNGRGSFTFNGIDRLDNALGYVYSNCVACCKTCNYMKRTMSVKDFLVHIRKMAAHQKEGIWSILRQILRRM